MISDRKLEHLLLCLHSDVEYHKKTGFEDVELVHRALPEVNLKEIDISLKLLGKQMDAPLIITAITGGHPSSTEVNQKLGRAALKFGIGLGLGSQRAAIENPELAPTYTIARKEAPEALIMGNIGTPQLKMAKEAAEMMELDALAVHLNPLQEAIQPEGDLDARGYLEQIKDAASAMSLPLVVKETGAGIRGEEAIQLEKAGVKALDVAGAGGTSWAAVETYRSQEKGMGELFWDWGIPTAACTVEAAQSVSLPIISSGGVRNGLQAAKAIALGASAVGIALPALKASNQGEKILDSYLERFLKELKVAMFLVGASNLKELQKTDLVIKGETREWLIERDFDTQKYARRSRL
ncbi:MAG TPA: type 2 isopentenyl-diphosphate Delta-isomerase [Methanobacteriaceae archaeon]|nr:type 2 isopentenyl-diphosphate Delta-isomerase [Methanobacteriaceae archaeon]